MKERPILFSGPMVRALLDGTKTQTRRIVKPSMTAPRVPPLHMEPWIIDGEQETDDNGLPCWSGFHPDYPGEAKWFTCPHGAPGDRLWVRETWQQNNILPLSDRPLGLVVYRADDKYSGGRWRPSIFMPRTYSRITLEITDVRVERVQDITTADACAEGVPGCRDHLGNVHAVEYFKVLWDGINGPRGYGWASNPWVWALTLRRLT